MQGDNVQLSCISMRTNGIINMQDRAVSNSNDHFKERKIQAPQSIPIYSRSFK